MGAYSAIEAIGIFRKMMSEMGLANPKAVNRKEELQILAHSVNPIRLKNNPVELNDETIKILYKKIIG